MYDVLHERADRRALSAALQRLFVADRPDENAGMIAVALNQPLKL